MKTGLNDLNKHLFDQLEQLNEPNKDKEIIENKIKKANAVSNIAKHIISLHELALDAKKLVVENRLNGSDDEFKQYKLSKPELKPLKLN